MTPFEWVAIIIAAVGAATAGYSAYAQGSSQRKASNYQAEVAENQGEWAAYNAKAERDAYEQQAQLYEINAQMVEKETQEKAAEAKTQKERLLGAQAVRFGKAGLQMEGTPLTVMAQTALEADKSIESILYEGGVEAWNWRNKGQAAERSATMSEIRGASSEGVYEAEASLNLLKGQQAGKTGIFGAGSTILTGASSIANMQSKTKVPTWDTRYWSSNGPTFY